MGAAAAHGARTFPDWIGVRSSREFLGHCVSAGGLGGGSGHPDRRSDRGTGRDDSSRTGGRDFAAAVSPDWASSDTESGDSGEKGRSAAISDSGDATNAAGETNSSQYSGQYADCAAGDDS